MHMGMRNRNQILHGNQTRCRETFAGLTTRPALANIFAVTNADADSVCGG